MVFAHKAMKQKLKSRRAKLQYCQDIQPQNENVEHLFEFL